MTQATNDRRRSVIAAHPLISAGIAILLAADIFFALYTPIYARITPKLGDFPFFYWYLLIFMPVTSAVLWLVTQLQKRINGPGETQ
jgi:drug/metabolite transporter (DMT)-like permease